MSADPLHVDPPTDAYFDSANEAWVVSRYVEVRAALGDARLLAGIADPGWHRQYRANMSEFLSRAELAGWEEEAELHAQRLCTGAASAGQFDIVPHFTNPWAEWIACRHVDLRHARAGELARVIFRAAAEPFDDERQREARTATQQLAASCPTPFGPVCVQAFVAISQSVAALITNAAFALMSTNQLPKYAGTRAHTDELLRYASPSKTQVRQAGSQLEIGAAKIREGQRVVLMTASANRDQTVFRDPDRLDLCREAGGHLAFGSGAHGCTAATFTHTCLRIALRVLADVCADARIVAARGHSEFALRSIASLELTWGKTASLSTTPRPVRR